MYYKLYNRTLAEIKSSYNIAKSLGNNHVGLEFSLIKIDSSLVNLSIDSFILAN